MILVPFCIVGGIKWRPQKDQETQLLRQINLQMSLQTYRHVRNAIKVSLKTVLSAIGAPNKSIELALILLKVNWLCCVQPQKIFCFLQPSSVDTPDALSSHSQLVWYQLVLSNVYRYRIILNSREPIFQFEADYYKHTIKFTKSWDSVKIRYFITNIWLNFMYKVIKSFDFNKLIL